MIWGLYGPLHFNKKVKAYYLAKGPLYVPLPHFVLNTSIYYILGWQVPIICNNFHYCQCYSSAIRIVLSSLYADFPITGCNSGGNGDEPTITCYSGFAWSPSWLTAQLRETVGWRSRNKHKRSSPQTPKLWLRPHTQSSASWERTHQAWLIQLRREHESCLLPGIHLTWVQLNWSKNIL